MRVHFWELPQTFVFPFVRFFTEHLNLNRCEFIFGNFLKLLFFLLWGFSRSIWILIDVSSFLGTTWNTFLFGEVNFWGNQWNKFFISQVHFWELPQTFVFPLVRFFTEHLNLNRCEFIFGDWLHGPFESNCGFSFGNTMEEKLCK
jgi:hypothetical protein